MLCCAMFDMMCYAVLCLSADIRTYVRMLSDDIRTYVRMLSDAKRTVVHHLSCFTCEMSASFSAKSFSDRGGSRTIGSGFSPCSNTSTPFDGSRAKCRPASLYRASRLVVEVAGLLQQKSIMPHRVSVSLVRMFNFRY